MKLFRIKAHNYSYDEYDSCIVAAESIKDVKKMIEPDEYGDISINGYEKVFFGSVQGPFVIEEINLNNYKNKVILGSFNAG